MNRFNRLNGIYQNVINVNDLSFKSQNKCIMKLNRRFSNDIISSEKMKQMLQSRKIIKIAPQSKIINHSQSIGLSVGSYNILAQYQLLNNSYLYTHCEQNVLDWTTRWKNLKADLELMNCDIFCLQEVQCDHFTNDIEPVMKELGYFGFLSPKTGKKLDGCAMFIKRSKFNVANSQFHHVLYHRDDIRVLRTDNVGQVALLELQPLGDKSVPHRSKLCIANTHLFFNPNHGEVKLAELCVLIANINHLAADDSSEDSKSPIIICGDFNSEPTSDLYRFMTTGQLKLDGLLACNLSAQNETSFFGRKTTEPLSREELPPRIGITDRLTTCSPCFQSTNNHINPTDCHDVGSGVISHGLQLKSAYVYSTADRPRMVTAFTNADTCAVDFIFYHQPSPKVSCIKQPQNNSSQMFLEQISYLELFTSQDFFSFGGIPNAHHGSDHIPLLAHFKLHY